MPSLMFTQMGLSAIGGLASVGVSAQQAKLNESIQQYRNTISALQAAQSRNVLTENEIGARDASIRQDLDIQRQGIMAEGQARTSSAEAGVSGGSTSRVMQGLRNSVARAQYGRTERLEQQYNSFGQERRNVGVAQALNKDISVMPRPSATSTLLGIGTDLLKIYDAHQPAGDRLFDPVRR